MTRLIILSFCLLTSAGILLGAQAALATGGKLFIRAQTTVHNQAKLRQDKMEDKSVLRKMQLHMNHMKPRLDSDLQGIADLMLCESSKAIG